MNILLARHGETPWNKEGRYQGHTDIPLSPDGEAQAKALGRRLAEVKIDRAVASPLSRARTTAELVLGPRASMLTLDSGFKEISHGEWEGKLVSEIQHSHAEQLAQWKAGPAGDFPAGPGAESFRDVLGRAWLSFERACTGLKEDQTLLIVAHDAVNRAILCRVLGLPFERVWTFRQAPATLNVLSGATPASLSVVRLNDAEHLGPLLTEQVHRAL